MKTFRYPLGHAALSTLTVGELLSLLAKYPHDMPVLAAWEGQLMPLGVFSEVREHDAGFPADRCQCLILDAEYDGSK